ncbi:Protein MAIN-LIKE 1 [Glycine soja]
MFSIRASSTSLFSSMSIFSSAAVSTAMSSMIMVRTRGLRRALDRVLGRVSGDKEEAPQRRRMTTSTRRQPKVAAVAKDIEHVDHAVDSWADYAVAKVWAGEEHTELKLDFHGRKVEKYGRLAPEIEGIMAPTCLSFLIACSLEIGDMKLLFAFVERWHKETSSFHLPIGKMSITLDDVALLLYLPIIGALYTYDAIDVEQAVELLVELLEVTRQKAVDETEQCQRAYVFLAWLRDIYRSKCDARQWTLVARTYLLHLVGCILFANKSATHINVSWIYEHFPTIGNMIANEDYHERKPCACRWKHGNALLVTTYRKRLDRLTTNTVCWIPYGNHCGFKEFELISLFSGHIRCGSYIVRHLSERFSQYLSSIRDFVTFPGQCAIGYMELFYMISHPFMSLPQLGEPPRHPPMVHDPTSVMAHPSVLPVDTTAMPHPPAPAPIDVDMPRHAAACQRILESLQHMLDMRVAIVGIDAYNITKHCLRLARGVIEKCNVYVRSR